jgi:flagellar hook-associated protein 3 FlgL
MRITSGMLHESSLRALGQNTRALSRAQEVLSSGRRLVRPSDDPNDVVEALRLRDGMEDLDQYRRNIDVALRRVTAADSALGAAGETMQRARELALHGANASLSAAERRMIALEIEQLAGALVGQAATRVGDIHIFSGHRTATAPFPPPPAGSATTGPYAGDAGNIVARVEAGVTIRANVTADVAFGPALAALAALHADLVAGSPPSTPTLASIDAGLDRLLESRATIGASAARLEQGRATLDEMFEAAERLLSELEDADMVAAVTELTRRQATYEAALAATSRILERSLFDELR